MVYASEGRHQWQSVCVCTKDVLQAMIAALLSYNVNNVQALNDIIDLYALVNIEQQT